MSWQKCPLCNGSGIDPTSGTYSSVPICPTCKGTRIISELSGLPPIYNPTQNPIHESKLNSDISGERSSLQEH